MTNKEDELIKAKLEAQLQEALADIALSRHYIAVAMDKLAKSQIADSEQPIESVKGLELIEGKKRTVLEEHTDEIATYLEIIAEHLSTISYLRDQLKD